MNKYLQSLLFVSINLSVCLSISAQSSRVETDIKNQKIEIIPSSVVRNEQNIPEIKATEVLNPSLSKTDSLKPTEKSASSASLRSKSVSKNDKYEDEIKNLCMWMIAVKWKNLELL